MALFLLEDMPLRERRVALRGDEADVWAWTLAQTLCPQVGTLFLDFDRGEEALGAHLRTRYGAAPIHLGLGPEPRVALEMSPRSAVDRKSTRLKSSHVRTSSMPSSARKKKQTIREHFI